MSLSQHKEEKRVCPGCQKAKVFPVRNATCSNSCAEIMRAKKKSDRRADPAQIVKLQLELKSLRSELKEALERSILDEGYQKFVGRIENRKVSIPEWTRAARDTKSHDVIPVVSWSDWHLDEVVKPSEVHFRNGYDRPTALLRLKKFADSATKVAFDYMKGFRYQGLVLASLGDIFSGAIHEELRKSNADVMLGSMLYWIGPVVAMLRQLADAFGTVHIPVVVGNHGRNSIKPIFKGRVRDNFDWFFMQLVAREIENLGDKRITFSIPESMKMRFELFGHGFIASHGDECKGGSGIAGMLSPQLIAYARMQKTYDFKYWILGHWHNLGAYRNIRVNGAGKGWDEYAMGCNFDYQEPQQDFFLVNQRDGVIGGMPIFVKCKDEPWMKKLAA